MNTPNVQAALAFNIQQARKKKDMIQRQVAAALGIKEKRYASYEEGRATPSPEVLVSMAKFFEIDDLVSFITVRGYSSKKLTATSY